MKWLQKTLFFSACCLLSPASLAADPLNLNVSVGSETVSAGYSDWESFINALDGVGLEGLLPGIYTGTQQASMILDIRGLQMLAAFPNDTHADFEFSIPEIGFSETITDAQAGGDRDTATSLMQDKLESADVLGKIARALARTSPSDPVAGNPNSLMSTTIATDFNQTFTSDFSNIAAPGAAGRTDQKSDEKTANLIGIGIEYGQMTQGNVDVKSTTLPLSYTIRNDLDPRRQLMLRMPITYTDVGGAKALQAGLGISYRFPMSSSWSLTPSFNYALVGSADLLSAAQLATAGITSTYFWRKSGYDIGMGNMLGYATTLPFTYDGKKYDPDINNTVVRNGVLISVPTRMLGGKMHFETALIDTRFFGSDLYANNQQELKFTIGTTRSASLAKTGLFRAGLAFIRTPKDDGFKLDLGYWF